MERAKSFSKPRANHVARSPPHIQFSSLAQAEDPVRPGSSVQSLASRIAGSPTPVRNCAQGGGRRLNMRRRSRDMFCPRFCQTTPALSNLRAQGKPGACRTRGLVCQYAHSKRCTRAYRFGGSIPAFPAQWLYGLLRALPGERLFCLRRRQDAFASCGLNASTTAPEPYDFTVRLSRTRPLRPRRPSHLPRASVTMANAPHPAVRRR